MKRKNLFVRNAKAKRLKGSFQRFRSSPKKKARFGLFAPMLKCKSIQLARKRVDDGAI
jgi:hypothetical protein